MDAGRRIHPAVNEGLTGTLIVIMKIPNNFEEWLSLIDKNHFRNNAHFVKTAIATYGQINTRIIQQIVQDNADLKGKARYEESIGEIVKQVG